MPITHYQNAIRSGFHLLKEICETAENFALKKLGHHYVRINNRTAAVRESWRQSFSAHRGIWRKWECLSEETNAVSDKEYISVVTAIIHFADKLLRKRLDGYKSRGLLLRTKFQAAEKVLKVLVDVEKAHGVLLSSVECVVQQASDLSSEKTQPGKTLTQVSESTSSPLQHNPIIQSKEVPLDALIKDRAQQDVNPLPPNAPIQDRDQPRESAVEEHRHKDDTSHTEAKNTSIAEAKVPIERVPQPSEVSDSRSEEKSIHQDITVIDSKSEKPKGGSVVVHTHLYCKEDAATQMPESGTRVGPIPGPIFEQPHMNLPTGIPYNRESNHSLWREDPPNVSQPDLVKDQDCVNTRSIANTGNLNPLSKSGCVVHIPVEPYSTGHGDQEQPLYPDSSQDEGIRTAVPSLFLQPESDGTVQLGNQRFMVVWTAPGALHGQNGANAVLVPLPSSDVHERQPKPFMEPEAELIPEQPCSNLAPEQPLFDMTRGGGSYGRFYAAALPPSTLNHTSSSGLASDAAKKMLACYSPKSATAALVGSRGQLVGYGAPTQAPVAPALHGDVPTNQILRQGQQPQQDLQKTASPLKVGNTTAGMLGRISDIAMGSNRWPAGRAAAAELQGMTTTTRPSSLWSRLPPPRSNKPLTNARRYSRHVPLADPGNSSTIRVKSTEVRSIMDKSIASTTSAVQRSLQASRNARAYAVEQQLPSSPGKFQIPSSSLEAGWRMHITTPTSYHHDAPFQQDRGDNMAAWHPPSSGVVEAERRQQIHRDGEAKMDPRYNDEECNSFHPYSDIRANQSSTQRGFGSLSVNSFHQEMGHDQSPNNLEQGGEAASHDLRPHEGSMSLLTARLSAQAQQGNVEAVEALGLLVRTGAPGLPAQPEVARGLLMFAAEAGSSSACHALGEMYKLGEGGEVNIEEAEAWAEEGAKLEGRAEGSGEHLGGCPGSDYGSEASDDKEQ